MFAVQRTGDRFKLTDNNLLYVPHCTIQESNKNEEKKSRIVSCNIRNLKKKTFWHFATLFKTSSLYYHWCGYDGIKKIETVEIFKCKKKTEILWVRMRWNVIV